MKNILLALLICIIQATPAFADTFVVNNPVDPGNGICDAVGCTLREAIDAANANPGADIINFSIFGAGVKTITPTSALPTITEAVTIDGYTQPGAAEIPSRPGIMRSFWSSSMDPGGHWRLWAGD